MNKRAVYLKSISCKGIKSPIPFQTPSLYATVSLSTTSQRHKTPVDTANGENAEWECPMRFDLSAPSSDGQELFLEFDLKNQVPVLGDRLVGKATVPVSDLINGGSSGHVGYQVLWPDGKPNGTIQLWYRIEGTELPRGDNMVYGYSYSSPQPSAPPPPAADFSYKPPVQPGPVYPPTKPGPTTTPFAGPVTYPPPPMSSLAAHGSEPVYPGVVEPGRVYGTPFGAEFMPYPPPLQPSSSGIYPPPASGFGSVPPSYPPPPKTQNPLMDQAANTSACYDCYPPPGNHNRPANHGQSASTYYPPPGTQYPPALGSDCCDSGCQEPVVAYPPANGYNYPPPPRYPYY